MGHSTAIRTFTTKEPSAELYTRKNVCLDLSSFFYIKKTKFYALTYAWLYVQANFFFPLLCASGQNAPCSTSQANFSRQEIYVYFTDTLSGINFIGEPVTRDM